MTNLFNYRPTTSPYYIRRNWRYLDLSPRSPRYLVIPDILIRPFLHPAFHAITLVRECSLNLKKIKGSGKNCIIISNPLKNLSLIPYLSPLLPLYHLSNMRSLRILRDYHRRRILLYLLGSTIIFDEIVLVKVECIPILFCISLLYAVKSIISKLGLIRALIIRYV